MLSFTLLVIENDPALRDVICLIFNQLNIEVVERTSSRDAVAVAKQIKPCVVLMNYGVRPADGAYVVQMLKSSPDTAEVPVIVYSTTSLHKEKALKAGADAFIEIPFDIEDLEALVESVFQSVNLKGTKVPAQQQQPQPPQPPQPPQQSENGQQGNQSPS